ncbi:hypothetical protein SAMN05518849_11366 [Sphingobium sp. AP50]|uniref:hypothetical protein n=1 Tax=Sphingobium sp. AP50 TaxID=1884369 RepID=UPI0008B5305F|nr:hypothetical protein [Sphingobium sp. AP50]SEJ76861.1 hypothetical protein SAMN05518849_11366 [Sphingobium sp. AP50]
MRAPTVHPLHIRSTDEECITAADIEAWAKVERALSGKREACRKLRVITGRIANG